MPEFNAPLKCLKQVSDACQKSAASFARQKPRHLSDTCPFYAMKTAICGCLTKCLMLSDRPQSVTVCLAACPLDAPDQTPRQTNQTGG